MEHGKICTKVEYLEKGQDELWSAMRQKTNEIKDARKSLTHDLERRDRHFEEHYISKHEFEPIKRLVYATVLLMVADVIRRILI